MIGELQSHLHNFQQRIQEKLSSHSIKFQAGVATPSPELLEIISTTPLEITEKIEKLAEITRLLAPEHGRSSYGEPLRGLTPWEIYTDKDAEKSLKMAREALHYAMTILKELVWI